MRVAALYLAAYAVVVGLSIPTGALLSVVGGLLFGTWVGGTLAVVGATAGGVVLFLIARYALSGLFERRAGGLVARLRPRLERDGISYLLALRLIPVVPFWVTNLAPALCGMRLLPYTLATVIGIAPATFIFASIGAGVDGLLAAGRQPDLSVILAPRILLPLCGLAALSLVPTLFRRGHADA